MLISFKEPEMLAGVLLGVEIAGQIELTTEVYAEGIHSSPDKTVEKVCDIIGDQSFRFAAKKHTGPKRQTIRPFDWENPKPRSPHNNSMPGDTAHIWWKSRTKNGFKIGEAKIIAVHMTTERKLND